MDITKSLNPLFISSHSNLKVSVLRSIAIPQPAGCEALTEIRYSNPFSAEALKGEKALMENDGDD